MGKFKGQLPGAPTLVFDGVIGDMAVDFERSQNDEGKWVNGARKGRILGVQTGGVDPNRVPDLEAVKVPLAFDDVPFEIGQHVLINVEQFSGDYGVSYRFVGFVSQNQFDAWKGVIAAQQRQAQSAA